MSFTLEISLKENEEAKAPSSAFLLFYFAAFSFASLLEQTDA